jgi:hypothetical protein
VAIGFRDAANDERTAYSAAMSVNLLRMRQSDDPHSFSWLLPSTGTRAGAHDIVLRYEGNNAIISWGDPASQGVSRPDDLAIVMAINTTTLVTSPLVTTFRRSHQKALITLPPVAAGEHLRLYLFFADVEAKNPALRNVSEATEIFNV